MGRPQPLRDRRSGDDEQRLPEPEHHLHGAHRARRPPISRRRALGTLGTAVAAATLGATPAAAAGPAPAGAIAPGRLRQSVARWCFARTPIDTLCRMAASAAWPPTPG
ncbi:MAG: hypothetical protein MUF21_14230 [Gemmatimonadaceae bacterium]|nr:hypothetical protein [Gemmatimonadaceae bacterium]